LSSIAGKCQAEVLNVRFNDRVGLIGKRVERCESDGIKEIVQSLLALAHKKMYIRKCCKFRVDMKDILGLAGPRIVW